jgi:hypothetical protein
MGLEVSDGYVVVNDQPPVVPSWITALDEILAGLPNASMLTTTMKETALHQSAIPDANGVWPGKSGYSDTFDIYWAAIQLISFLKAQPFVNQTASEGTSITVSRPDWGALVAYYQSMSPIAGATAAPALSYINIPSTPVAVKVDMNDEDWKGRRTSYGDVNTSA